VFLGGRRESLLVDFVLAGVAVVQGEVVAHSLAGAAEESTKVFVQVGEEGAVILVSSLLSQRILQQRVLTIGSSWCR